MIDLSEQELKALLARMVVPLPPSQPIKTESLAVQEYREQENYYRSAYRKITEIVQNIDKNKLIDDQPLTVGKR